LSFALVAFAWLQQFQGQHGRAYLFCNVCVVVHLLPTMCKLMFITFFPPSPTDFSNRPDWPTIFCGCHFLRNIAGRLHNRVNVTLGKREHRSLITGMHVVADIFCTVCENAVGWKYVCVGAAPLLLQFPYWEPVGIPTYCASADWPFCPFCDVYPMTLSPDVARGGRPNPAL
jgi:hypothetical protein